MDIRQITDSYSVSPQIECADVEALAEAGYTTVICNRPDAEIPPFVQADAIKAAVEAAGLKFVLNPVPPGGLSEAIVETQAKAISESSGPAFAYCASGNRSTLVWALTQAGTRPTDEIISAGAAHGYNVEILRGMIDMLASRKD